VMGPSARSAAKPVGLFGGCLAKEPMWGSWRTVGVRAFLLGCIWWTHSGDPVGGSAGSIRSTLHAELAVMGRPRGSPCGILAMIGPPSRLVREDRWLDGERLLRAAPRKRSVWPLSRGGLLGGRRVVSSNIERGPAVEQITADGGFVRRGVGACGSLACAGLASEV